LAVSRILYRLIASLAGVAVRSGRSKDLELIVLRHQLGVLHRQIDRPEIDDDDRTLLDAIPSALPRPQRTDWIVTPDTLLRWHRRRMGRHWTQPSRGPGCPSTATEIRQLVLRLATENPTRGYRCIRSEVAGRTIIWNQHQLERLVIDYMGHYNELRPHRSLEQRPPLPTPDAEPVPPRLQIVKSTRCDDLVNGYRIAT